MSEILGNEISTTLKDAPSDGNQYARKDGTWTEVQSGVEIPTTTSLLKGNGSGGVSKAIAGTDYQSSLNRTRILVQSPSFNTSTTFIYTGCSFTVPKNKAFFIFFRSHWMNGKPLGIALSSSNTSLEIVADNYYYSEDTCSAYVCGLAQREMPFYVWAKHNLTAGNGTITIDGILEDV